MPTSWKLVKKLKKNTKRIRTGSCDSKGLKNSGEKVTSGSNKGKKSRNRTKASLVKRIAGGNTKSTAMCTPRLLMKFKKILYSGPVNVPYLGGSDNVRLAAKIIWVSPWTSPSPWKSNIRGHFSTSKRTTNVHSQKNQDYNGMTLGRRWHSSHHPPAPAQETIPQTSPRWFLPWSPFLKNSNSKKSYRF